jgi:serine/threonine-protein kinase HipA
MAAPDMIPVYYEAYQVGGLTLGQQGAISFSYDSRWLDTSGIFPISLSMPLGAEPYGSEIVHPWLANLLPEEHQLAALAKIIGVDRNDTVAVLREIGGDTAGALSFGEPSLRENWTYTTLEAFYGEKTPDKALLKHFEDLKVRPFLVGEDGIRLSLAGGQQKTALTVLGPDGVPRLGLPAKDDALAIPRNGAPSTLIIKPDNPNVPGIVENEAYCLALASAIGIEAVETQILKAGDRNALAVARYDRDRARDGRIRRRHQEDFAQANRVFPTSKYEMGTFPGPSLQTLFLTGQNLPSRDALRLLDKVIFNIVVANTDAHAKNYSLLLTGERALAPFYDVSCVLPWKDNQINQNFAQKISGKKRRPGDTHGRHWDAMAESAGYNARETRRRVEAIVDSIVREGPKVMAQVADQPAAVAALIQQAHECVERNALKIVRQLKD